MLQLQRLDFGCLAFNYTHTYTHMHTNAALDDKPTLPQILSFPSSKGSINLPQRIGNSYYKFGVLLLNDKTGAMIGSLETKNLNNPHRINCDIFTVWLQGSGCQPVTWRKLVEVLEQIELLTLAEEIEEELGGQTVIENVQGTVYSACLFDCDMAQSRVVS